VRAEQRADFATAGPAALAKLRQQGVDPAHGGAARKRRADTMHRRHREATENKDREPAQPNQFEREILPAIQNVPLRRLAEATGLSLSYCALIRAGERVPRPRHWQALARVGALVGSDRD